MAVNISKTLLIRSVCIIFLILVFLFPFSETDAQVFFNSTHTSVWNKQYDQPALVGQSNSLRSVAAYRSQWNNLEGAPQTFYFGSDVHLPIKNLGGGIFIAHDRLGATAFTTAKISLSYSVRFKKSLISAGLSTGLANTMIDGSKITTPSTNIGIQDPILNQQKESGMRPDLGVGIAYIHQFIQADLFFNNIVNSTTSLNGSTQELIVGFGRYAGLGAVGNIPLGTSSFSLNPGFLLKTDFNKYQIDAFLTSSYEKKYTFGLGFRGYNKISSESLIVLARIKIVDRFSVGYSYDFNLSKLEKVNRGSHELSLQYDYLIKYQSNRTKIVNHPRFL